MTTQSAEQSAHFEPPVSEPRPEHVPACDSTAIDRCLEQLSQLAQSEPPEIEFYEALLVQLLAVLPAAGGAAWRLHPTAPTQLLSQKHFPPPLLSSSRPLPVESRGKSRVEIVGGDSAWRANLPDAPGRSPIWPLIKAWVPTDSQGVSLVELALPKDAGPDTQRGAAQLLEVVAEIAADYHRRRELALLRSRSVQSTQLAQFVARLHSHLDPTATAYTLAHEGQRWIGCDRVSVVCIRRGRAMTLAVSGAPHVDRRSGQVTALEQLSASVAAGGELVAWQEGQTDDLAPEISARLHAYLDRAHARQWVAIPLARPTNPLDAADAPPRDGLPPFGLIIAESFAAEYPLERLVERTSEFARWSQSALGNALQHHAIPFLSLQTRLGSLASALARRPIAAALGVLGLATILITLAVVPAEFYVQVEGTLQPQVRRHLFAPSDGVVEDLQVDHGDKIAVGEPLLRIRNPALELEMASLRGDLQTAQSKLAAVRAARSRPSDGADASEQDRLASEEQQLGLEIQGLENQLAIADQFQQELQVTSPLAGIVLTWNTHQVLDDRPVKQGQLLLTVADPAGPWGLELRIPDRQAGHILASRPQGQPDLPVTYLMASDPAITHRGKLRQLALASDIIDGRSAADAVVTLDDSLPPEARAGTHVTARIHCGRRSLGYVWLHDLIDFLRTSLPF
jgi:multidrug efflux pump subunit AcrA (membrane-fusion protein)